MSKIQFFLGIILVIDTMFLINTGFPAVWHNHKILTIIQINMYIILLFMFAASSI